MAIPQERKEKILIEKFKAEDILTTAVDVGGNINSSMTKIIERALVASKRCGLIKDCHVDDGAVVGATREALLQIMEKANGIKCRWQNRNSKIRRTYKCVHIYEYRPFTFK